MIVEDIKRIRILFEELKEILEKEIDIETEYIIKQLEYGLHLIEVSVSEDLYPLYLKLKKIYENVNRPRVGLSDYFVWRDNYEERIKANHKLDVIKNDLSVLLKRY